MKINGSLRSRFCFFANVLDMCNKCGKISVEITEKYIKCYKNSNYPFIFLLEYDIIYYCNKVRG